MTKELTMILALAAGAVEGATIRGAVVENQSGHPLARGTVTLQPVGAGSAAQSVRTNSYGIFEFPALAAGVYVVSAARLAFAPVQYGQKRWHSSGMPITLTANDSAFLTIRMPRYGAIAGTVLDENDVGLPEHEVAVYTNTRPPKLLARARTDDRGMYRLFGLQPGSYLVRSMSKLYDDGGYLPTFFRDSHTVDQARPVEVTLDEQVDRVDFHAAPGRLSTITGRVLATQFGQSTVALASDTGTEIATIDANGNFSFNPMAPGQYELLAQGPADRVRGSMAAYQPIALDRDLSDIRIPLSPLPTVQFVFEDSKGQPLDPRQLKVMARRKDIAGDAKTEILQVVFDEKPPVPPGARNVRRAGTPEEPNNDPLRPVSGKVPLLPGRWDVALVPTAGYCVVGFTPPTPDPTDRGRTDGWNEMLLTSGSDNVVKFVLSSSPATLSGTVKTSGGDPIVGVPVFIEPYDLDPRKRLAEIRSTRTNAQGQYSFGGLAPGVYRLLGTFDYQLPDAAEMEAARATTVKVEEGSRAVLDLEEFVIH
jgi:hypothetical protein